MTLAKDCLELLFCIVQSLQRAAVEASSSSFHVRYFADRYVEEEDRFIYWQGPPESQVSAMVGDTAVSPAEPRVKVMLNSSSTSPFELFPVLDGPRRYLLVGARGASACPGRVHGTMSGLSV